MKSENTLEDDLIDKVRAKVSSEGPQYLEHLLKTLELNKLESQYQDPEGVPLFKKEYDELGLVIKYEFSTSQSALSIPWPREHFEFHEIDAMMQHIIDNQDMYDKLIFLLQTNVTESVLVDMFVQKGGLVLDKGPLIEKQYDKKGFYTANRLNPRYNIEVCIQE